MSKKHAGKKGKAIKVKLITIGTLDDADLKELIMCGVFEQMQQLCPRMSEAKAMILAQAIAEDIVATITAPATEDYAAAEAMEPGIMRRLAEELDAQEAEKAKRAQLVTESMSDWLSDTIGAVLGGLLGKDKAKDVSEKIFMELFEDDGGLKFCRTKPEADILQDMRQQLGEQHEPRPAGDEKPTPPSTFNPDPGPGKLRVQPDLKAIRDEINAGKPEELQPASRSVDVTIVHFHGLPRDVMPLMPIF